MDTNSKTKMNSVITGKFLLIVSTHSKECLCQRVVLLGNHNHCTHNLLKSIISNKLYSTGHELSIVSCFFLSDVTTSLGTTVTDVSKSMLVKQTIVQEKQSDVPCKYHGATTPNSSVDNGSSGTKAIDVSGMTSVQGIQSDVSSDKNKMTHDTTGLSTGELSIL